MISKLRLWLINHKNVVKMSRFSLLTLLLLLISWFFDHRFVELKSIIPDSLLLPLDVSLTFLSNISGVFLTISIFALTTIITVLNKYSSSVTPRMAQDFIDRADVLTLHGIFVGGFFYCVISLFMLQNVEGSQRVISGTLGIIYSIISMIGFVVFSQRVLHNLKMSNIIENVSGDCDKLIDEELELRNQARRFDINCVSSSQDILAEKTGYLFDIAFDDLLKIIQQIEGCKAELLISRHIGEYTPEGSVLASLNFFECPALNEEMSSELQKKLSACFVINIFKNEKEDYHHEMVKLSEIALMALSPGINDPNTAIICINKLSTLLGKLFSSGTQYIVVREKGESKIVYQNYSVDEELYLLFSQIMACTNGDPLVSEAILEGLYMIYMLSGEEARQPAGQFFEVAFSILMEVFKNDFHRKRLKSIRENMELQLGQVKEQSSEG